MELLTHVVTTKLPPGLLPNKSTPPRLRLTDLKRFEKIIEDLARTWEDGRISYSREQMGAGSSAEASGSNGFNKAEEGTMMIWEVTLGAKAFGLLETGSIGDRTLDESSSGGPGLGKRKRIVDEDADSAAGNDDDDDIYHEGTRSPRRQTVGVGLEFEPAIDGASGRATSSLGNLSKELREVYSILQRGTAKGRLLAEQFRSTDETFEPICPHITKDECAKVGSLSGNNAPCSQIHFRPLIRPHTDVTLGHCSYLNTCYSEPTYSQSPSIPPFPGSASLSGGVNLGGINLNATNARGPVSLPSGLGAGGRGKEKAPCRYLHYEVDWDGDERRAEQEREKEKGKTVIKKPYKLGIGLGPMGREATPLPPQWINCDLRRFDYSVLGKFHVIMADPPWDIHMSLPYGTMTDDEMRAMPIPALQDEGLLFLWVTGRAMEVGRECLRVWGYTRVDEVVWVKTNQLQRVIRTGRTGHWLNHTKEHMLVGIKNPPGVTQGSNTGETPTLKFPSWINRGLDTDVIVSEVRETSRKPDEVYNMIERMCPGGRKVEIFGRKHNVRPGWITLGNQLGNVDMIWEEDLRERVKKRYPERTIAGGDENVQ
ncbi:m6a methyltransferase [Coprinopsis cinerea okayama7|uniref:mRNA m(6)A methyltransferase n=1 Tax=Coprinopsis cinerea (strain Okayama-7 / 130 / ATCC MYA-4618 / FGSC 9003) TaxID=240176 RepID=D6RMU6_COPC7|nr:m6a methyltransferase [Coprinopsis cinerea okayama7\|eukprot:XP_002911151.1 m6a methyltransferase [Coprinopsis cinerea okayama7\